EYLREREPLAEDDDHEDHRDHDIRRHDWRYHRDRAERETAVQRGHRDHPGEPKGDSVRHHARLERGPSARDPYDNSARDEARGLHRERRADRADAARADARGVVGETPDDGRAGAEEESFQV